MCHNNEILCVLFLYYNYCEPHGGWCWQLKTELSAQQIAIKVYIWIVFGFIRLFSFEFNRFQNKNITCVTVLLIIWTNDLLIRLLLIHIRIEIVIYLIFLFVFLCSTIYTWLITKQTNKQINLLNYPLLLKDFIDGKCNKQISPSIHTLILDNRYSCNIEFYQIIIINLN